MVPIEQLGEENLLNVYYIATEIKKELEMTKEKTVVIPAFRYVSPTIRFYPIAQKNRKDALDYMKDAEYLLTRNIYDEKIYVSVLSQEVIFSLCNRLLTIYQQRFTKPNEGKVKVDALAEEQIEKLHKIIEMIAIRLSMSRPPHTFYIPIAHFPQEIQPSDIVGLLYKLANDFEVLIFSRMVGEKPLEMELEIRFATGDTMIKSFLELQKNVEVRYLKIIAERKKMPLPTLPPKKEPLEVRLVRGSETALTKTEEEKKYKFPHKLPRGTKWDNITIKFLDDDNVRILFQGKEHTTHYNDMGFEGKGRKPSVLWSFLRVLAMYAGEIKTSDAKATDKYKKQKQSLSEILESYFGIDFDPFYPFQMQGKTSKSYRVKFILLPPDNGFSFQKKKKMSLLETPKENNPFADLNTYMNEVAPIVAQIEANPTDVR